MRKIHRLFFTLSALMFLLSFSATAYVLQDERWEQPSAVMNLRLTASPAPKGAISDGSKDWNEVARKALERWNGQIRDFKFVPVVSSAAPEYGDDVNTSYFSYEDVYGDEFEEDGPLGVCFSWHVGGALIETDIVFNAKHEWDSYRGKYRYEAADLYRVALHEFGHAIGLDHPDDFGQSKASVMNSILGDIDDLTADDIAGGQKSYGKPSPTPTPTPKPTPTPTPKPTPTPTPKPKPTPTPALGPTFRVFATKSISAVGATVRVHSAANSLATTHRFEYGPVASGTFGLRSPSRNLPNAAMVIEEVFSGLIPATEYQFRLVAGKYTSPVGTFTTAKPLVSVVGAVVSGKMASLTGEIARRDSIGSVQFEYSTSKTNLLAYTEAQRISGGQEIQRFTAATQTLEAGKQYYYRLKYLTEGKTFYSSIGSFKSAPAPTPTPKPTPTFKVLATQERNSESAKVRIQVTSNPAPATYSIKYGDSGKALTLSTAKVSLPQGNSTVQQWIRGLAPNKKYDFQLVTAKHQSALGSFTTLDPVVRAFSPTSVKETSATLKGSYNPKGGMGFLQFEYGTSASKLSSKTPKVTFGRRSSTASVSAKTGTLKKNTKYYYRLKLTFGAYSVYSDTLSFKTSK